MDNQTKLIFWFDDDLDGTGRLWVEASANGFSGIGEAYFSKSQIEEFANALFAYPLKKENLPEIIGGYGDQLNLNIKVYPTNGTGNLAIQVKLATDLRDELRQESQHFVQLEIPTHYSLLEVLAKELISLINGRIDKVSLKPLN